MTFDKIKCSLKCSLSISFTRSVVLNKNHSDYPDLVMEQRKTRFDINKSDDNIEIQFEKLKHNISYIITMTDLYGFSQYYVIIPDSWVFIIPCKTFFFPAKLRVQQHAPLKFVRFTTRRNDIFLLLITTRPSAVASFRLNNLNYRKNHPSTIKA